MAFTHYRTVTIDHTKVGGSDLTNFPVGILGTYTSLATVSNGGHVQNVNGYDIRPYADAALTQPLVFEMAAYDAATGAIALWVRVPSLSHTANTTIYLAYGDASISTTGSSATTWSANYAAAYHLGDDPNGVAPQLKDSAAVGRHMSVVPISLGATGATVSTVAGIDGKAFASNTTNQYRGYMAQTSGASGAGASTVTVQSWVKVQSYLGDDDSVRALVGIASNGYPSNAIYFGWNTTTHALFAAFGPDTLSGPMTGGPVLPVGAWSHVVLTWNQTTQSAQLYVNGVLALSGTLPSVAPFGDGLFWFNVFGGRGVNVVFDEARVSSVVRSADWITAEYNNQASPATFYAVGAEAPVGVAGPRALVGTSDGSHYAKSAGLGTMGAFRVEMRVTNIALTGATQNLFRYEPMGTLTLQGDGRAVLFSSFKGGESASDFVSFNDPVFTSQPRRSELILRFQFNPAIPQYSIEVWDLNGGDLLQKVITSGVTASNLTITDFFAVLNSGYGNNPLAGHLDFCRIYNTNVAVGSAAPALVASGAPLHAWEYEDTLVDSGSSPLSMVWQGGGAPSYADTIAPPIAAPTLATAVYSTGPDVVTLTFDSPNIGGVAADNVDIERRLGTTGDWVRLGFTTVVGATTYVDQLPKHSKTYNYRVKARNRLGSSAYSNVVSVTTGAGTDTNPVITENAKAGTSAWTLTNPASAREIEGYADQFSVNRGGTINFKVSSAGNENFTLEVFRMGWYGGLGARRIRNVTNVTGALQTTPAETGAAPLYLRECSWTTSYSLTLTDADPTEWTSGIYLARLTQVTAGKQAYIIFCVRDDSRQSALYYNQPVFTYHAYNAWPSVVGTPSGRSTYPFNSVGGTANDATAEVAFNRPYAIGSRADTYYGIGAGDFLTALSAPPGSYTTRAMRSAGWEINWLRFLEKNGHDVQYGTDMDLHTQQSDIWARCFGLLFPGHAEYVTLEQRDTVLAARDYGRNLAFLGANAYYWQVRLTTGPVSGTPKRAFICYKTLLSNDPITSTDPRRNTALQWRQLGNNPVAEESFIGTMYEADPAGDQAWAITSAGASHPLLAGTGLGSGATVPGLVGYEWDHSGAKAPAGTVVLSHSVFTPGAGFSGALPIAGCDMTVYDTAKGAEVFATGSMQAVWGVDDFGVAQGARPSYLSTPATTLFSNAIARQSTPTISETATPTTQTSIRTFSGSATTFKSFQRTLTTTGVALRRAHRNLDVTGVADQRILTAATILTPTAGATISGIVNVTWTESVPSTVG